MMIICFNSLFYFTSVAIAAKLTDLEVKLGHEILKNTNSFGKFYDINTKVLISGILVYL